MRICNENSSNVKDEPRPEHVKDEPRPELV
jgi:hypothetical protein